jgi:hypothetical protein
MAPELCRMAPLPFLKTQVVERAVGTFMYAGRNTGVSTPMYTRTCRALIFYSL